jgi:protein-S-isoprenylcysteine O-methyltransferase Ste14
VGPYDEICGNTITARLLCQPLPEVPKLMQRWRTVTGTLLILMPLLLLLALPLLGVLFGSLGMDIHWTSTMSYYATMTCIVLMLCACVMAGVHLRRSAKRMG